MHKTASARADLGSEASSHTGLLLQAGCLRCLQGGVCHSQEGCCMQTRARGQHLTASGMHLARGRVRRIAESPVGMGPDPTLAAVGRLLGMLSGRLVPPPGKRLQTTSIVTAPEMYLGTVMAGSTVVVLAGLVPGSTLAAAGRLRVMLPRQHVPPPGNHIDLSSTI